MTKNAERKYTPGDFKAVYFEAHENDGTGTLAPTGHMKRAIHAIWHDDQGRRCTQFVAEVFEQAAHPEQGEANARLLSASKKLLSFAERIHQACAVQANLLSTASEADRSRFIAEVYAQWNDHGRFAVAEATGKEAA